jgi:cytokinin dehydrogenase
VERFSSDVDPGAFARSLVAEGMVRGFDPQRRCWVAGHSDAADLAAVPKLEGRLLLDLDAGVVQKVSKAHLVHNGPAAVLLPKSTADVASMLRFAGDVGVRVAVRGQDDQGFGAELDTGVSRTGLLIDMRTLDRIHAIDAESIRVDAGLPWHRVVDAALQHGLTPPVLTEVLDQSVASTLSVGGVGSASWRYGAQVDNTLELSVVTGNGRRLECSALHNRELFEAVLAGQGQCAVITEARLRLVPAPSMVRAITVAYTGLIPLLRDLNLVRRQGRFDQAHGLVTSDMRGGWFYLLHGVRYFDAPNYPNEAELMCGMHHLQGTHQSADVTYAEYVHRIPVSAARASFPAIGVVLPESTAIDYLCKMLGRLEAKGDLALQLFSWDMARFTRPLFRRAETLSGVGAVLLRYNPPSARLVERVEQLSLNLFQLSREMGGAFYPLNPLGMTRRDWERHYGPEWTTLANAKSVHDPRNVLASGPDIF